MMRLKTLRVGILLKTLRNKIRMIWLGYSLRKDLVNSETSITRKKQRRAKAKRQEKVPRRLQLTSE
jgi:hypothetical protein